MCEIIKKSIGKRKRKKKCNLKKKKRELFFQFINEGKKNDIYLYLLRFQQFTS